MMRDKYLLYVDAEEIILTMFGSSLADHFIDVTSLDDIRCGITVFCNDIKNYLIDYYGVDQQEGEE